MMPPALRPSTSLDNMWVSNLTSSLKESHYSKATVKIKSIEYIFIDVYGSPKS